MTTTTTTDSMTVTSNSTDAAILLRDGVPSLRGEVDDEKLLALASKLVSRMSTEMVLPGLDPLIGRRARALALCHSAFLASFTPDMTEESVERAVRLADVFRRHHDSLAGCTWWSWESTKLSARAETLKYFDRAVSRAQLGEISKAHNNEIAKLREELVGAVNGFRTELVGAVNGVAAPLNELAGEATRTANATTAMAASAASVEASASAASSLVGGAVASLMTAFQAPTEAPEAQAATAPTEIPAATAPTETPAQPTAPADPVAAAEAAEKAARAEFAVAKAKADAAAKAVGDARRAAKAAAQAAQAATQPAA